MVFEQRRKLSRQRGQLLGFYREDYDFAMLCAPGKIRHRLHAKRMLEFFSPLGADFDHAELCGGEVLLQ